MAGDEVSHLVPPVASALADVRRPVQGYCGRCGCGEISDSLTPLSSEVVANAIIHGKGPITLRLRQPGRSIRVLADDHDPVPLPPPAVGARESPRREWARAASGAGTGRKVGPRGGRDWEDGVV